MKKEYIYIAVAIGLVILIMKFNKKKDPEQEKENSGGGGGGGGGGNSGLPNIIATPPSRIIGKPRIVSRNKLQGNRDQITQRRR